MSRSKLRSSWMQKNWNGTSCWFSRRGREIRNTHRQDEAPKNRPSKYVELHCSAYIPWLQEPTSFGGHRIQKSGHRIVSGLVRASVKREVRKEIQDAMEEQ